MNYLWGEFVIALKICTEFFSQRVSGSPTRAVEQYQVFFPNIWEGVNYVLPPVSMTKPPLQHTSVTWSLACVPLHDIQNHSWQLSLFAVINPFLWGFEVDCLWVHVCAAGSRSPCWRRGCLFSCCQALMHQNAELCVIGRPYQLSWQMLTGFNCSCMWWEEQSNPH